MQMDGHTHARTHARLYSVLPVTRLLVSRRGQGLDMGKASMVPLLSGE